MKKFCSKCGAQLDLGKKSCSACNAFNPYFIAGFAPNQNEPVVEKTEPLTHTTVIETPDWQKENAVEIERLRAEQHEQQKAESELKYQLLKVKEENEQFKKETFSLVKDVQKELHDIEKENKLLKEKVELLNTVHPEHQVKIQVQPTNIAHHKTETKKGVTAIAAICLLIIVTSVSYYFFSSTGKNPVNNSTSNPSLNNKQAPALENKGVAQNIAVKDSTPAKKLLAVASAPVAVKAALPTTTVAKTLPSAVNPKVLPESFVLTETKLKTDLIGKKLSGCDVTIKSSAEIASIGNLILVDKLSASYLKYKCTVKIKQGSDVYTSTPYIYYSAEGTFIKVDGTNCE